MAAAPYTAFKQEVIKTGDDPEPELLAIPSDAPVNTNPPSNHYDPKDPEGFLRRCSGFNKKNKTRCGAILGPKSRNTHATYLATCRTHRDQRSYAGWCKFVQKNGEMCGRLFRWVPPYLELCPDHRGHPDTPCHFLKLPLELRLDIFRYLLPTEPIGSSTSPVHKTDESSFMGPATITIHTTQTIGIGGIPPQRVRQCTRRGPSILPPRSSVAGSIFPSRFCDLLLVNRQVYNEVKDLLYSTVPFTIDIRKDGTFMCGRRLLEPRRADGSSHFSMDDATRTKQKFLASFDWAAVKNYNVDILVENGSEDDPHAGTSLPKLWDEEVEIYDIRDYVRVVISGILSKSRQLCKLNVRVCLSSFGWHKKEYLENVKTLVEPFERLRNVRQPRFCGVYAGTPSTVFMINTPLPFQAVIYGPAGPNQPSRLGTPLCSVPRLPTRIPILIPGDPEFDEYRKKWERWISTTASYSLGDQPPITTMFSRFRKFYTRLSAIVPEVGARHGRSAFLHRARVAREHENVEAFRHLQCELIEYWYDYLEQEELKKKNMKTLLHCMFHADRYPCHEVESHSLWGSWSTISGSNGQSPVPLDVETMVAEGIPMQGNQMTDKQKVEMRLQQIGQEQQWLVTARQNNLPSRSASPMITVRPRTANPNTTGSGKNALLNVSAAQQHAVMIQRKEHQQRLRKQRLHQLQAQCTTHGCGQQSQMLGQSMQNRNQALPYTPTAPQPQSLTMPTMPTQTQLQDQIQNDNEDSTCKLRKPVNVLLHSSDLSYFTDPGASTAEVQPWPNTNYAPSPLITQGNNAPLSSPPLLVPDDSPNSNSSFNDTMWNKVNTQPEPQSEASRKRQYTEPISSVPMKKPRLSLSSRVQMNENGDGVMALHDPAMSVSVAQTEDLVCIGKGKGRADTMHARGNPFSFNNY